MSWLSLSEWLLFLGLLVVGLIVLLRRSGSGARLPAIPVLGASLIALAGAIHWSSRLGQSEMSEKLQLKSAPRPGRDGGYVSSDSCRACHPGPFETWHRSYHRTMTQYARPDTVLGDFNNVTLKAHGETYVLKRRRDEFWVDLPDPEQRLLPRPPGSAPRELPRTERRVTLLTGSHHMQTLWVGGKDGNLQFGVPFSWLKDEQRWVPRNATFLMDPLLPPPFQMWNMNCLRCHTTAGQPRPDESGSPVLDTRVAEIGIGCEACHGPAEQHIALHRNPLERWKSWMTDGVSTNESIINPARLDHVRSSQVCGQCHSITVPQPADQGWFRHGFSYRPGKDLNATLRVIEPSKHGRESWLQELMTANAFKLEDLYWPDGMVRVSGRDYTGMIGSGCYKRGEMSCLSCHSMHHYEDRADQLLPGMRSNQACVQCHPKLGQDLSAHTHHRADSSGSLCVNCHMPHTTYGLMKAIRSHHIDSPDVAVEVATGRPNACNLCHLDRSLRWTDEQLTRLWGRGRGRARLDGDMATVPDGARLALEGDAGQRALVAWHLGWEPSLAASGSDWQAPILATLLTDPYPAVRYIAGRSLAQLPGFNGFPFDFLAAVSQQEAARDRALQIWRQSARTPGSQPTYLGQPDEAGMLSWIEERKRRRNDRRIYLKE